MFVAEFYYASYESFALIPCFNIEHCVLRLC
jgi:hypothetical protein